MGMLRPPRSPCLGILPPLLIVPFGHVREKPFGHVQEKRGIEGVRQDDLLVRTSFLPLSRGIREGLLGRSPHSFQCFFILVYYIGQAEFQTSLQILIHKQWE